MYGSTSHQPQNEFDKKRRQHCVSTNISIDSKARVDRKKVLLNYMKQSSQQNSFYAIPTNDLRADATPPQLHSGTYGREAASLMRSRQDSLGASYRTLNKKSSKGSKRSLIDIDDFGYYH